MVLFGAEAKVLLIIEKITGLETFKRNPKLKQRLKGGLRVFNGGPDEEVEVVRGTHIAVRVDRQPPTTAYSTLVAANAARSKVCFRFIVGNTSHLVQAAGKRGGRGEALGNTLAAPIDELLHPRLPVAELSRSKERLVGNRRDIHGP